MSYIDNNLMSGEAIVYRARLHRIIFFSPLFGLIFSILAFASKSFGFGLVLLMISIGVGLARLVAYITSEFGVTDRRVLIKVGFLRRKSLELLLNKVEGIQVDQGILGRVLGYGSIVITGTGGLSQPFSRITNPLEFRRKVQERISQL